MDKNRVRFLNEFGDSTSRYLSCGYRSVIKRENEPGLTTIGKPLVEELEERSRSHREQQHIF